MGVFNQTDHKLAIIIGTFGFSFRSGWVRAVPEAAMAGGGSTGKISTHTGGIGIIHQLLQGGLCGGGIVKLEQVGILRVHSANDLPSAAVGRQIVNFRLWSLFQGDNQFVGG